MRSMVAPGMLATRVGAKAYPKDNIMFGFVRSLGDSRRRQLVNRRDGGDPQVQTNAAARQYETLTLHSYKYAKVP
jgi:hypothetical protein